MAKKSAKSKGYRRQTAKKPYLSKRDIAILCGIVAVLAVAAFFLFRYDDGALKVKDGAVVTEGDNWLIANGSNMRGGARYYKLGEIGEIDGYSRQKGALTSDGNIPEYTFTPAGEDAGDVRLTVTCGHGSAEAMAKYAHSLMENTEGITASEVQNGQLGGRDARWYGYDTDLTAAESTPEDAHEDVAEAAGDADAAEANRYSRAVAGYIDAGHECCVIFRAVSRGDTEADCLDQDALQAMVEKAVGAVTVEEGGK